jgi:hypothetical protein
MIVDSGLYLIIGAMIGVQRLGWREDFQVAGTPGRSGSGGDDRPSGISLGPVAYLILFVLRAGHARHDPPPFKTKPYDCLFKSP